MTQTLESSPPSRSGPGRIDGLLLVATIPLWSVAVDAIAYRWLRLGVLVKGRPRLLVEDGRIDHRVLRRELMTREELLSQLLLRGLEDLADVRRADLELHKHFSTPQ